MIQNWKFQRGDIFFTRFDNATGSEQSGNRPAVVLQNDVGNFYSPTLIVATLTSKAEKKVNQPTHCLLENAGLNMPSVVQAEQIFTIDKSRALKYLGHLTPEDSSVTLPHSIHQWAKSLSVSSSGACMLSSSTEALSAYMGRPVAGSRW